MEVVAVEVVVVDVVVDVDEEIVVTDTLRIKTYLVHVFSVFLPFLLSCYQN